MLNFFTTVFKVEPGRVVIYTHTKLVGVGAGKVLFIYLKSVHFPINLPHSIKSWIDLGGENVQWHPVAPTPRSPFTDAHIKYIHQNSTVVAIRLKAFLSQLICYPENL